MNQVIPLEINKRMPYMSFNWSEHNARTSRLTYEERGLFDVVRCELWTVAPPRLPLETLKARLRVAVGSKEDRIVDELIVLGLLTQDEQAFIADPIQIYEFADAVARAKVNKENGRKGGRPAQRASTAASIVTDKGEF